MFLSPARPIVRRSRRRRVSLAVLLAVACVVAATHPATVRAQQPPAAPAAAPKPRTTTKTVTGTLAAIDGAKRTLRLQPAGNGDALDVLIRDNSTFTKTGKSSGASAADFAAGDKVVARLSFRAAPAGEIWLRDLRDQDSQATFERDRKGVTVGTVAKSGANVIEVRRADGSVAAFGISRGTVVRKQGASARIEDFAPGSHVVIKPRATFGKLNAAIVADTKAEIETARLDGLARWRGTVQSVDAAKSALTMKRQGDDAVRTVSLAPNVSVKKARASSPLSLADVAPGTFVDVRLAKGANAAVGQRTASEIRITTPRKTATQAKSGDKKSDKP